MKKIFAIMLVAVVISTAAFAQEEGAKKPSWLSAGIGGFIAGDFGGGGANLFNHTQSVAGYAKEEQNNPYFGGGGFLFLDVKYAELSLGFFGGGGASKYTYTMCIGQNYVDSESETDCSYASFNIGLLLKYPFGKTDKFKFFPLVGLEYQIMLSARGDGEDYKGLDGNGKPGDFSALWIKAGVGFDIAITKKIYARFEALYGIRTPSKADEDLADFYNEHADALKAQNQDVDVATGLGHGLTVNLAVGYKF